MNIFFRNFSLMLAAGALAVSCADYNETNNFPAEPDPSVVSPYSDLGAVKSYANRNAYPNMSLGAQIKLSEFNNQAMQHAAAITNFDEVFFGTDLMAGKIINGKGSMNFVSMTTMVDHAKKIGAQVYGCPIAANTNQPEEWFSYLTAPIEIIVDFIDEKSIDFTQMSKGTCTDSKGTKAEIKALGGKNQLYVGKNKKFRVVEDFKANPLNKYTITFVANADKSDASFNLTFSGNAVPNPQSTDGKYTVKAGKRVKFEVECRSAEGETDGYLRLETMRSAEVYIETIDVGYYPDNHRDQTDKEVSDTIHYALNAWCDGLMKNNAGCIKTFDLIDEPINVNATLDNGKYDLKHAPIDAETGKAKQIFWQDVFGSEKYAPTVAEAARKAYEKYGNNPAELKFFIAETGLDEQKKLESLIYWIDLWENSSNGNFKVDGINAKLSLVYSEDATKQDANEKAFVKFLEDLAATGKLIRVSNFDIKYQDAAGATVTAQNITKDQRQQLADFYARAIKSYLTTIPKNQQAGICKGNMVDTSDPVGLWANETINSKGTKDWVRTATYKAFCDAIK